MKPSHLTTPRNLSECRFEVGYALANPQSSRRYDPSDYVIFWGCAIAAAVSIAVMVLVPGAW